MLDAATLAELQAIAESAMLDTVTITTTTRTLDAGGAPAAVPPSASSAIPAIVYLPKIDLPRATAIVAGDQVTYAGRSYFVKDAPQLGAYDVLRTIEVVLPAGDA